MGEVKYRSVDTDKGNLVIREFIGTMSKVNILDSFNYLISSELLTESSCGLITDISSADISLDMADLEKMVDFISNNSILSKIKIAVVANTPARTLFPTLANFKIGDTLIPFSSMEAAEKWITSN